MLYVDEFTPTSIRRRQISNRLVYVSSIYKEGGATDEQILDESWFGK
jgi:hypothetical protein